MMLRNLASASFILVFLMVAQRPTRAQESRPAAPSLDAVLPQTPLVVKGTLSNGLTYYVRKNTKPENRAELWLVVNTGSVLEDETQIGLAHFVEHMAFNGTENFPKQDLVNFLESVGMRFGPDINASTSFDQTVYMLQLPTDSLDVFRKGMQVLEDWAHAVSFEEDEIERERGVIVEEWRLGRGANARMRDKQLPILFRESRYAVRLPIGTREALESFETAALRQFYRDWYRPDLMAVVVVGDVDVEETKTWIGEHFGHLGSPPTRRDREIFPVPDHEETLFAIASDPEAMYSTVSVYRKVPVRPTATVGDYRREIIESLFSQMLNQRFNELTQKPDPPFLAAFTGQGRMVRSKEVWVLSAFTKDNGIPLALRSLVTETRRVQLHGFTATELEREKIALLRRMEKALEERDKTESRAFASECVRNFLEGEPMPGIESEYTLHDQLLPGIRLEEINDIAREILAETNRVVMVNSPEKEGIVMAGEDTLEAILAEVRLTDPEPYVDAAVATALMETKPTGGSIVGEATIPELEIVQWTLGNGVRVVLKPTDFKNDEVRLLAFSPGGYSLVQDRELVSAQTATGVMVEGGVGAFGRIELDKLLSGKIVRISPYISRLTEGLTGTASPKDLEEMFQLVYLYCTAPRFDSTAYRVFRSRMETVYQNRAASPEAAFFDTLNAVVTQYHPRFRSLGLEDLAEMDLGSSERIYRDRFADASDFTFLIVGAFDPVTIRPLVERYLGTLPSTGRTESWGKETSLMPSRVEKRVVYKGTESKSLSALVFTGPFSWTAENRLVADALTSVLRIKLRERIREDLGGTYGVSVSGMYPHYPEERYRISIQFGAKPERVEDLIREVFVQIDSVQNFGVPDSYLQKVTEAFLRQHEVSLKENGYWIGTLEFASFHGEDPKSILEYERRVRSLTSEAIQEAARSYLRRDRYVHVILYPEEMK